MVTRLVPVIKMKTKLSTVFVIAQAILLALAMQPDSTDSANSTDTTMRTYGCFDSGLMWTDLGTTEAILAAYDEQWCSLAVGVSLLGDKVNNAVEQSFYCRSN